VSTPNEDKSDNKKDRYSMYFINY